MTDRAWPTACLLRNARSAREGRRAPRWANHTAEERHAALAKARRASPHNVEYFERQLDPDEELDPTERRFRAEHVRTAYFQRLAFRESSRNGGDTRRRRRNAGTGPRRPGRDAKTSGDRDPGRFPGDRHR